jgi:hypothetical protein
MVEEMMISRERFDLDDSKEYKQCDRAAAPAVCQRRSNFRRHDYIMNVIRKQVIRGDLLHNVYDSYVDLTVLSLETMYQTVVAHHRLHRRQ